MDAHPLAVSPTRNSCDLPDVLRRFVLVELDRRRQLAHTLLQLREERDQLFPHVMRRDTLGGAHTNTHVLEIRMIAAR